MAISFQINAKSVTEKAGLFVAPFFFISALLCIIWASRNMEPFLWLPGLLLLGLVIALQQERGFALSWISGVLGSCCLMLFFNALYLSPTYHVNGIYFPTTLLIAFIATTCCPVWFVKTGFKLFCGVIILTAVWALLQWSTGWQLDETSRAVALFTTPNTLATLLNLGLVPILSLYLLGSKHHNLYFLTLLLYAALLATQSRGGYLGLVAGFLFLLVFTDKATVIRQWQRYCAVACGFVTIFLLFKLYAGMGHASWRSGVIADTLRHGDSNRWDIYQIAWQGLAQHLWLGNGYFNFGYYFEAHKTEPFFNSHVIFVHNDYLQFAFETGLLGLSLFLLLLVAVYGQLFRFRQQVIVEQNLPLILSATAITSMLAHALVDYPFYIPILQAVFAAYLGIINRQLIDWGAAHWQPVILPTHKFSGLSNNFIGTVLLMMLIAWLGLPILGLVSADYGLSRLQRGDSKQGVLWHSIARTLQPREADYYWREGIMWREQGIDQNRPDLLEKSTALFSKGAEVNPFEVKNLLEKIAMYRQYGTQFKQQVSHQELMSWINHAKSLQPHSDVVQWEYIRCLEFVGEHAKAVQQATAQVQKRPQSKIAKNLLASLLHD